MHHFNQNKTLSTQLKLLKEQIVSEIFTNNIDSREETSSSSGSCGKTSSSSGCGVTTDDPCGRTFWSRSSGCGYEPDPCGGTFWGRSSSC